MSCLSLIFSYNIDLYVKFYVSLRVIFNNETTCNYNYTLNDMSFCIFAERRRENI